MLHTPEKIAKVWKLNDERNKQLEAECKRKHIEANLALVYKIADS